MDSSRNLKAWFVEQYAKNREKKNMTDSLGDLFDQLVSKLNQVPSPHTSISIKQYREALAIVKDFQKAQYLKSLEERVKPSDYGKKILKHSMKGIVSRRIDDYVEIIWENGVADSMHQSLIEKI